MTSSASTPSANVPPPDPRLIYGGEPTRVDSRNAKALVQWLNAMAAACTVVVLYRDYVERLDLPAYGYQFLPGGCRFANDLHGKGHIVFGDVRDPATVGWQDPTLFDVRLSLLDVWDYAILGPMVTLRRRAIGEEYTMYFVQLPPPS